MDNPALIRSARLWLYRNLTRPLTMSLVKLAAAGVKRYSLDDEAFELFRQRGFYLLREHFYLPIPDEAELSDQFREGQSELVGLDMNDSGALDLLDNLYILFIDSTHVLREGGDVKFEYCEILPRLATGVFVHVHDISLPKAYPRVYFEKHRFYWNEQYVLQAFLAFNSRFEVIWPGNYMITKYPKRVCKVFPEYHATREAYLMSEPSSFWMRVKA